LFVFFVLLSVFVPGVSGIVVTVHTEKY